MESFIYTVALRNTLFWLAKCYNLQLYMATGFKTNQYLIILFIQ